ncbi:MAG: hypothetical protein JSW71_11920 [Gemmatimonadota bacterium]|nr:MAG: hypothetical protein JSW71_11920 [Gemmatimonadota bacterium]
MSYTTRFILCAMSITSSACLRVPQQTGFLAAARNVDRPVSEVRLIGFEFGRRFSTVVEQAADSIRELSIDPSVRYNAIAWKAYAIPAAQEAVLQFDPLVGLVDAWVFSHQMRDFFATGRGSNWFGPHQQIAIDASIMLEREAYARSEDLTDGRLADSTVLMIDSLAREEPIGNNTFSRASVSLEWTDLVGASPTGLAGTAANMERQLDEVTNRLAYYNEYLFKQARWQSELMIGQVTNVQQVDSTLTSLRQSLAIYAELAGSVPELVASERTALVDAIERERISVVEAIDLQRIETVGALEGQVDLLLRSIGAERALILAAVNAERIATLASLDSILAERIDQTKEVVDRLVWRLAQLVAVLGLVLLLVGVGLYRLLRGGRRPAAA